MTINQFHESPGIGDWTKIADDETGTPPDPGAGNWTTNAANTRLVFSDASQTGLNLGARLLALVATNMVYLRVNGEDRSYVLSGAPVDHTTHVELPVTLESSSTGFTLNTGDVCAFDFKGGGGGTGAPFTTNANDPTGTDDGYTVGTLWVNTTTGTPWWYAGGTSPDAVWLPYPRTVDLLAQGLSDAGVGAAIGDLLRVVDVGGSAGLPALVGDNLTGVILADGSVDFDGGYDPAAGNDQSPATKKYVDDNAGGGGGPIVQHFRYTDGSNSWTYYFDGDGWSHVSSINPNAPTFVGIEVPAGATACDIVIKAVKNTGGVANFEQFVHRVYKRPAMADDQQETVPGSLVVSETANDNLGGTVANPQYVISVAQITGLTAGERLLVGIDNGLSITGSHVTCGTIEYTFS